mmetsp:Transcript_7841/g.20876  ORF Transcript_7841/g.20876 Transcript_7841/m.20876 type:complete len:254 (-) Transcript_7841:8149-8910(-)
MRVPPIFLRAQRPQRALQRARDGGDARLARHVGRAHEHRSLGPRALGRLRHRRLPRAPAARVGGPPARDRGEAALVAISEPRATRRGRRAGDRHRAVRHADRRRARGERQARVRVRGRLLPPRAAPRARLGLHAVARQDGPLRYLHRGPARAQAAGEAIRPQPVPGARARRAAALAVPRAGSGPARACQGPRRRRRHDRSRRSEPARLHAAHRGQRAPHAARHRELRAAAPRRPRVAGPRTPRNRARGAHPRV